MCCSMLRATVLRLVSICSFPLSGRAICNHLFRTCTRPSFSRFVLVVLRSIHEICVSMRAPDHATAHRIRPNLRIFRFRRSDRLSSASVCSSSHRDITFAPCCSATLRSRRIIIRNRGTRCTLRDCLPLPTWKMPPNSRYGIDVDFTHWFYCFFLFA